MTKPRNTIFAAVAGIALVVTAGVCASWAYQASRERDALAFHMQAVRANVIPHSFAFTTGLTGPKRDKETVLWASDIAKAAGVRIGDEIHLKELPGVAYTRRTQVNDVISEVEYPAVKQRQLGAYAEGLFWNDPGPDGYRTVTVVLPRDVPMTVYLKHSDGTTSDVMI